MEEVSYEEYLGWFDYFDRQPVGWREDIRTFQIMNAGGNMRKGTKAEDVFPSIKQLQGAKVPETEEDEIRRTAATFKASPFGALFASAREKATKDK